MHHPQQQRSESHALAEKRKRLAELKLRKEILELQQKIELGYTAAGQQGQSVASTTTATAAPSSYRRRVAPKAPLPATETHGGVVRNAWNTPIVTPPPRKTEPRAPPAKEAYGDCGSYYYYAGSYVGKCSSSSSSCSSCYCYSTTTATTTPTIPTRIRKGFCRRL